jgi:hypothetical protein
MPITRPHTVARLAATASTLIVVTTLAMPGPALARAVAAGACEPSTRTVTSGSAQPQVLSPRGHVVTRELSGGLAESWLYRPDGSKVRIAFKNGASPYYVRDVNGRGTSVGTLNLNVGAMGPNGDPWVSQGGRARHLPTPADGAPTYYAESINRLGAIAGVATNFPASSVGDADFEAVVVVWPDRRTLPSALTMPTGTAVEVPQSGWPLVNIGANGSVSAVVIDPDTSQRYFARWGTAAGQPLVKPLPASWRPTSLAGQWIVGTTANATRGFVASADVFVEVTPLSDTIGPLRVTSNGTWMANLHGDTPTGDAALVGLGLGEPGTTDRFVYGADVVGPRSGQLLFRAETQSGPVAVMDCAIALPKPTDVTVSAPVAWGG